MAASQFLQFGEYSAGLVLELVGGEVAVHPGQLPLHSYTDIQLCSLLNTYVTATDRGVVLGAVDTMLGKYDVRRPDLLFFATERLDLITADRLLGLPDLCIEIVSESSAKVDRVDKFEQYAAAGIEHYWIADPMEKSLAGYGLHRGKYVLMDKGQGNGVLRLPLFAELAIPLARLWMPDYGKRRTRIR